MHLVAMIVSQRELSMTETRIGITRETWINFPQKMGIALVQALKLSGLSGRMRPIQGGLAWSSTLAEHWTPT